MFIGISASIHQPKVGAAAGPAWLISGGVWNDAGVWDDTATWDDGVLTWSNPDLTTAAYDSVSFSPTSQEPSVTEIVIKSDGTKMYVIGSNTDAIYQYALSTSWDISTASYESKSLSVSSEELAPTGLRFKDDGTSAYVVGGNDAVYQYNLSTAWDVSTGSYASKSLSVTSQETNVTQLFFKDDGTKVYVIGATNDAVYQYALSTAWDISTGSYESKSFSVSSQSGAPQSFYISPNGDKMWVMQGFSGATVYQYSLSTAWDISTASYDSVSFSVSSQDAGPNGIEFKTDGQKMYITGGFNNTIYQYST